MITKEDIEAKSVSEICEFLLDENLISSEIADKLKGTVLTVLHSICVVWPRIGTLVSHSVAYTLSPLGSLN